MCTGVQLSVVLDHSPEPELWNAFAANTERALTLTNLDDGRVHVACFAPLRSDVLDLRTALRELSAVVRTDIERLRG